MNNEDVPLLGLGGMSSGLYKHYDRYILIGALFFALMTFIAVIVGNTSATSAINSHTEQIFENLSNPVDPITGEINAKYLPHAFSVEPTAVTPVKDQQSRGTCWAFSTVGHIEASYRKHGLEKGFLKENEYVRFSEQAYALSIVDYCQEHTDDDRCYGTGPPNGSTEDGTPEWLYYFSESIPSVLPEEACPYKGTNDEQAICPDRQTKQDSNPIRYTVKSLDSVFSLSGVKELLYKTNLPLTWSHIIATQTYMVPCTTGDAIQASAICQSCLYPVTPGYVLDEEDPDYSQCLALYTVPSYDNEGRFSLHGQPFLSGGHAMQVVGYNDNFRVDVGNFGELKERTLGGFIIKNSWGSSMGHSINYWKQEISTMDESFLCPDETAAQKWLPADTSCMQEHATVAACSSSMYKRVRDQWVTGATELKCTDTSAESREYYGFSKCNPDKHYVLASIPDHPLATWFETPTGSEGYLNFFLLEFTPGDEISGATLVETENTTWFGLSRVLTPVSDLIGNHEDYCGFFFLPYQYFQEANVRNPAFGHDTPSISFMDIEWDDSSFLANKEKYPDFDYTYLEQSSKTMDMYKFDGPLDFNYNKSA
jgi:C1A family cysteine protease